MGMVDFELDFEGSKKKKNKNSGNWMTYNNLDFGGGLGRNSKNELSKLKEEEQRLKYDEKIRRRKIKIEELKKQQSKRNTAKWNERKAEVNQAVSKVKKIWYGLKPKRKTIYD